MHIEHTALIVENYDDAIRFFVEALGFDLVEDSPATTNDGRQKRWVVVRPPEAQTGLLLAEADGDYLAARMHTFHSHDGFAVEDGWLHLPDGTLLATVRQTRD